MKYLYLLSRVALLALIFYASGSGVALELIDEHTRTNQQSQYNSEALSLEPGMQIARELSPGQTHNYRISVRAGYCMRFSVQLTTLEWSATVYSPSGKTVRECQNLGVGDTLFSIVAGESGTYLVEMRTSRRAAGSGNYLIRFDEYREAAPEDDLRTRAESKLFDGEKLSDPNDEELKRQAVSQFVESLVLWRELNDRRAEALTLTKIGRVYYFLSEYQNALSFLNQALPIWQALKDSYGAAEALASLGTTNYDVGNISSAVDYCSQALSIWQSLKYIKGQARCFTLLAIVEAQIGNVQKAIELRRQSLGIYQQLNDWHGEAIVLNGLGNGYLGIGENRSAIDFASQALRIAEEHDRLYSQTLAHDTIGQALMNLGEPHRAVEHFTKEYDLSVKIPDPRLQAYSLRRIGSVYEASGEKSKALEYYERALTLDRETGNRQGEAAVLNSIGHVHELLGDKRKALSYYEASLPLARATADCAEEVRALYNIARAYRALNAFSEARVQIEKAIHLIESARSKVVSPQFRSTWFVTVQQIYRFYEDMLLQLHRQRPADGLDAIAWEAGEQSRARVLLDMLAEARAEIRKDIPLNLLERERSLLQLLNLKAERQMAMLNRPHTREEAEKSALEIRTLELQYKELQATIRNSAPRYATLTQPRPLRLDEIQKRFLDEETLLLCYSLGDERSYLWAITAGSANSYELPGRGVIERKAREVYDLMTVRQSFKSGGTERVIIEQQKLARRSDENYWREAASLSRMILGPVASQLANKRLVVVAEGALQRLPFGALPVPERGRAREQEYERAKGRKSISQDENGASGAAQSTIRGPQFFVPLIVEHEIVSLPSASILAAIRSDTAKRESPTKTVAVLADPVFERNDSRFDPAKNLAIRIQENDSIPAELHRTLRDIGGSAELGILRLRYTEDEALGIISLSAPNSRLLALGFDANRDLATDPRLSEYRFIHFATHGLMNNEHPDLSGLIFSLFDPAGRRLNGFLRLHDVYNLRLSADLVVLSACNSGMGKEDRGEGLMALTRGFMYAGAARIVASLWKVDDTATSILMQEFYRQLIEKKRPPAAALQEAQMTMWRNSRWRAPYYWAAFVLQGEYK